MNFPFSSRASFPIGIGISDHTVTILRLNHRKEVVSFGSVELDDGIVLDGKVLDRDLLGEQIREALKKAKPTPIEATEAIEAVLSIPESKTFTHVFTIPQDTPQALLREVVHKAAAKVIPVDPSLVYWDFELLHQDEQQHKLVLYVGTQKDLLQEYVSTCVPFNINPIAVDMESTSLGRAVLPKGSSPTMLLDIGARTTTVSVFDEGGKLNLSVSIPIAGNSFTQVIAERLKMGWTEAEHLKMTNGFDPTVPENRVLIILQERVQIILRELEKVFTYYEKTFGKSIPRVLLAGGSAQIPYLDEYVRINLRREVAVADPLLHIGKLPTDGGKVPALFFGTVIGLALRGLSREPSEDGINLLRGRMNEEWSDRERKLRTKISYLAIPVCIASVLLLLYVIYDFLYLPNVRLNQALAERITLNIALPDMNATPDVALPGTKTDNGTTTDEHPVSQEIATATPETTPQQLSVVVLDTPTGWLNVRSGAGKEYASVSKVFPGDTYKVASSTNEWVELESPSAVLGWVSSQYVQTKR